MTLDIAQLYEMLKENKDKIRYLNTLTKDELRAALRQVVEPAKWHETAVQAQHLSALLDKLSRDIEDAAKNQN